MMAYSRGGPASRTVALDLMLRTFMNSADFHISNPRIWENISKLVPGTTPQQVSEPTRAKYPSTEKCIIFLKYTSIAILVS